MTKDKMQYGNEKGLSINQYLINMINKILSSVDKNSNNDKYAVILSMIDASRAFERINHTLGVQSFIDNQIRVSLIPTLVNFYQNRKLRVKWRKNVSEEKIVTGGGIQGGTTGILEYVSVTNGSLSFLPEDQGYRFIDDSSCLEVLNLLSVGLSCYNAKSQVASDVSPFTNYLPIENCKTQTYY